MAQDRFYFWRGYYDALLMLPDPIMRDEFLMALCAYAFDGKEVDGFTDPMLNMAWMLVRDQARESVEIGRKQSEYGKRGGRPKSDNERVPKRVPKTQPKRVPKREPERVPESVRYSNVPTASARLDSRLPESVDEETLEDLVSLGLVPANPRPIC